MIQEFEELYKYRELLYMITYRDIRVRYKQSIMGFFWAILMPILIVASGIVVRYGYAVVAHAPLRTSDIAGVAIRSVPWAFIVSSIRFTCGCLTNNYGLVVKIYFPKEIFPMAAVLACLFDFFVAFCALLLFLTFLKVGFSVYLLWAPVLLATIIMFCIGVHRGGLPDFRDLLHPGVLRRTHVRGAGEVVDAEPFGVPAGRHEHKRRPSPVTGCPLVSL
jgi:lipopolysaccharide transport system permease protein